MPGQTVSKPVKHKATVTLKTRNASIELPAPSHTTRDDHVELSFYGLTLEQKDALADFFKGPANGMTGLWIYTRFTGRDQVARFIEPALVFVKFEDSWEVSLGVAVDLDALP